jgi:hypothetical protein
MAAIAPQRHPPGQDGLIAQEALFVKMKDRRYPREVPEDHVGLADPLAFGEVKDLLV